MEAAHFTDKLANQDGILLKLASVYEAPAPYDYFSASSRISRRTTR
jgi:hypothetical protein